MADIGRKGSKDKASLWQKPDFHVDYSVGHLSHIFLNKGVKVQHRQLEKVQ